MSVEIDIKNLLSQISYKLSQISCAQQGAQIGITVLSPPVDAPTDGEPIVLVNQTTQEVWVWDGNSWEPLLVVEQGLSMGSPIKLGDDAAGTSEPGILTSDRFINQDGNDVTFVGEAVSLNETIQTEVTVSPDGTLIIDKSGFTESTDHYLMRMKCLDVDNAGSGFNFSIHTEEFENNKTIESMGIGWNMAPAGTPENPARSVFGQYWEYEWPDPNTGYIINELHIVKDNERVLSLYLPEDHEELWSYAMAVTSLELQKPGGILSYFRWNWTEASKNAVFSFIDPIGNSKAVKFSADFDDNNFQLSPENMTAEMYIQNFSYVILTQPVLRLYTDSGGTPARVLFKDDGNNVSSAVPGSQLEFAGGTLNLKTTTVTPGVYANPTSITVNAYGQITAIS